MKICHNFWWGEQDGAQITLQSTSKGTFVSAEGGGGQQLVANRTSASTWETFKVYFNTISILLHVPSPRKYEGLEKMHMSMICNNRLTGYGRNTSREIILYISI